MTHTLPTDRPSVPAAGLNDARRSASQAMFAAAARVLRHHAAKIEARIASAAAGAETTPRSVARAAA